MNSVPRDVTLPSLDTYRPRLARGEKGNAFTLPPPDPEQNVKASLVASGDQELSTWVKVWCGLKKDVSCLPAFFSFQFGFHRVGYLAGFGRGRCGWTKQEATGNGHDLMMGRVFQEGGPCLNGPLKQPPKELDDPSRGAIDFSPHEGTQQARPR